jgi:hypothetical protein
MMPLPDRIEAIAYELRGFEGAGNATQSSFLGFQTNRFCCRQRL